MKDKFEREIDYLRISVTDLCNLRCTYCMPEGGVEKLSHSDILRVEEIESIVKESAALGIKKVRLTGGEPLVRKGIEDIIEKIAGVPGIEDLALTTNGILLEEKGLSIFQAGVKRLNISLDTLDPDKYREITRGGDLFKVLRGIDLALEIGFRPIKINVVLMGGVNDDEIKDFADFAQDKGLEVRFIELMPMGECADWSKDRFISADKVLEAVADLDFVGEDGVTRIYRRPSGSRIGLISPISSHFCPTCNKIRVTADGELKPCLHSSEEISLKGLAEGKLSKKIKEGILDKPVKHYMEDGKKSLSTRDMNKIGG